MPGGIPIGICGDIAVFIAIINSYSFYSPASSSSLNTPTQSIPGALLYDSDKKDR